MIIPSGAIVIAGGVVSFAVSRRLDGEARIFGGYFAGFAAGGLIAVLIVIVSPEDIQSEPQQIAVLTGLKELVCLAPLLGVGLAEFMRRKSQRQSKAANAEPPPKKPARSRERLEP